MIIDGIKTEESSIHSFLMIGQSNMAGRGNIGEVDSIHNPNCYVLRMGHWQAMREPINPDRPIFEGDFRSGVCLAASFADEVARNMQVKVGLIPCADGGTKIDQWMPGGLLYDHAVAMTRLAKRTSTLSGIIWHQGESDCNSDETLYSYKDKFVTMINSLRKDIGAEKLPVIIGELSESADGKWGMEERPAKLNKIFHEIKNSIPLCYVASANDLTLKNDGLHFNSASLRIFGKRYYAEYEKFASRQFQIVSYLNLPDDSKRIREDVFVNEQGFKEEFDTVDNYAIHFVAYDCKGVPVGTCRIFIEQDDNVYYLGRLAVLREYRAKDIGRMLVNEAEKHARSKGAIAMKLHSQCRASGFYERCGYSRFGEIDYEEECPHIWMQKIFNNILGE